MAPMGYPHNHYTLSRPPDLYSPSSPYYGYYGASPDPWREREPNTTLRGGTLLHKGFYDLMSMIPTPTSPSRLLQQWTAPSPDNSILAGPRYEEIGAGPSAANGGLPSSPPQSPRRGRRISKDMVSKPTGFVYVLRHTSAPIPVAQFVIH